MPRRSKVRPLGGCDSLTRSVTTPRCRLTSLAGQWEATAAGRAVPGGAAVAVRGAFVVVVARVVAGAAVVGADVSGRVPAAPVVAVAAPVALAGAVPLRARETATPASTEATSARASAAVPVRRLNRTGTRLRGGGTGPPVRDERGVSRRQATPGGGRPLPAPGVGPLRRPLDGARLTAA